MKKRGHSEMFPQGGDNTNENGEMKKVEEENKGWEHNEEDKTRKSVKDAREGRQGDGKRSSERR